MTDFIISGFKITIDDNHSPEIRRRLLFGENNNNNNKTTKKHHDQPRQHIKKQRHYFADKVCLVKAMVFPVVMYESESWTIKRDEHRRTDAFELWCSTRFLGVLWTARSKQSILKEISPEYSLEGLNLKLKLQYFGHLM